MRDEKAERSKQGQINNKAKQHSTPKTDPEGRKKEASKVQGENELPRVGCTCLYIQDRKHLM